MPTARGLMPELLEPWVTDIFYQKFTERELMYPKLFNDTPITTAFVDYFGIAGLGRFQVKAEGVPVGYDDPVQGDRKRTTVLSYALGVRFTEEMREDDQHGIISRLPADLANSARDSQERLAWGLVNDAHAGTTYTGLPEGDGTRRSLFNTVHSRLKDGGTWSNKVSPGVALSEVGLESAMTTFETMTSEEDRYITVTPKTLLIHPENRWEAMRLLESTGRVGTADNDMNTVSRMGLAPLVVPYITDQDSWSLWASKGDHTATYLNRKSLTKRSGVDGQTGDMYFIGQYRSEVDFNETRGAVGSAP